MVIPGREARKDSAERLHYSFDPFPNALTPVTGVVLSRGFLRESPSRRKRRYLAESHKSRALLACVCDRDSITIAIFQGLKRSALRTVFVWGLTVGLLSRGIELFLSISR